MPSLSRHTRALVAVAAVSLSAVAVARALVPAAQQVPVAAILVAVVVLIIGVRFAVSLRAERRYADVLEIEVASQTRSLVDALAATGAAERNLRLVMDAVPDAIAVLDRDGRIVDSNEPARALGPGGVGVGVGGGGARGGGGEGGASTVFDALDPAAAGVVRDKMAAAFRGEPQRFEVAYVRDDGSRGTRAVLYAPVPDGRGIPRILALVRDITDQKRSDAQLQQTEKLAAMGQLVSGVAHEINNPAAIISGFAQTLLLDDLNAEQREMVQMVYDEATRIGRITANLLAFARAGGTERVLVDVNDVVRRTLALRAYHLSTLNIAVSLELAPSDPTIWADGAELQQLFLNLLINAEQALVTVAGPRRITVRTQADERALRLEIADSGPGIPAEIRGKIFDPFFTTKPLGVGTGLGLSTCYGIAQDHGGRITVESDPGHGACFAVVLPRDLRDEVSAPAEPASPAPAVASAVAVLIIDDESLLRSALLRYFARRGIQGHGAADGAEALRVLGTRAFDVIICDVRMPGMSGREFLEHLRRDRPQLVARIVFTSGDLLEDDAAALIKETGRPHVTKPFDVAVLERVIREVSARAERVGPPASA